MKINTKKKDIKNTEMNKFLTEKFTEYSQIEEDA